MNNIWKRYLLLFIVQLPAFHFSFALFPGYGYKIDTFLIVWALGWMTWFTLTHKQVKKKWLYIILAFIIVIAGQLLSWISFLFRFLHG